MLREPIKAEYTNFYIKMMVCTVTENNLPLKEIVTNIYSFEEVEKALEDAIICKTLMVKSVIEF